MMRYRLLIVVATLIWGSSFVIVKDTTASVSPAWILVVRFFSAAVILAVALFGRRGLFFKREYVLCGALFGVALFFAYWVQTIAIMDTTPGKNAFLTATYCIMVPFVAWAIVRKRPNRFNIAAAVVALLGIGLVSLDAGLGMGRGDAFTLLCAVFYALHIALVSRFSQGRDIYVLTMWQFFFVGACSLVAGVALEQPPAWFALSGGVWASLAYLTIACTAVALLFQNIGQKYLSPSSAALLLSLESPFGVFFSVLLGGEVLTARILLGFAVIFAAILVSEVLPARLKPRDASE